MSRRLARRLIFLRERLELSQEAAAEKIGIGVAALRRLELGRDGNPSLAVLVSVAAAYGLEVWELLAPLHSMER